jgi:hypothetical protein
MHTNRSHVVAACCSVLALAALAGCGGASDAAGPSDGEVASLVESSDVTDGEAFDEPESVDVDDAALELSECLRNEGIEVPDIGVDADGNLQLRDVFREIGPGTEGFREAVEACSEILEGIGLGAGAGGVRNDPAIADAFLEFSDCIRDQGFADVPDLTLSPPGGGDGQAGDAADGAGAPPDPGQGRGDGGFGDRNARLADRLELDPDDPEVVAALDECAPIIDNALAGVVGPAGS